MSFMLIVLVPPWGQARSGIQEIFVTGMNKVCYLAIVCCTTFVFVSFPSMQGSYSRQFCREGMSFTESFKYTCQATLCYLKLA